jgi:AraC-like DNA-binding protein
MVWTSDSLPAGLYDLPVREHVLPTGMMHLVFRLNDSPLRIIESEDPGRFQPIGGSIVGGVRSRFYTREMAAPSCSVGAMLCPGAAELLFGASAGELAETHTPLADLWGASAEGLRAQLLETDDAENRLAVLESALTGRLPLVRSVDPVIAAFLYDSRSPQSVGDAVKQTGLSHRHFIARFRRAAGLPPKAYSQVLRFQRAVRYLRKGSAISLASVAAEAGYSDQAHFTRDFQSFAGVTPMAYRTRSPREANHLQLSD